MKTMKYGSGYVINDFPNSIDELEYFQVQVRIYSFKYDSTFFDFLQINMGSLLIYIENDSHDDLNRQVQTILDQMKTKIKLIYVSHFCTIQFCHLLFS